MYMTNHDDTRAMSFRPYCVMCGVWTDHGFECFSNASLLLRHDVADDPEGGVEIRDEEEDGIQHADQIEEVALALGMVRECYSTQHMT